MANPQWEDGHTKIANDLMDAMFRARLDGLEHDVLLVVIALTYRRGQTKAAITLEDIRYQLGGLKELRPARVSVALQKLLDKNILWKQVSGDAAILGVQKDYEKWNLQPDKMSVCKESNIYILNPSLGTDKTSAEKLVDLVIRLNGPIPPKMRSREVSKATELLETATRLTGSLREGILAVRDYLDHLREDEFFRTKIELPVSFMLSRYEKYQRSLPAKPKNIRETELQLGKRMRYNVSIKQWEVVR